MTIDEISTPARRERRPTRLAVSWRKLAAFYKACALIGFNMFILFLLCNGILGLAFQLFDSTRTAGPSGVYAEASMAAVYPHLDRSERTLLLHETWTRTLMPDDFTHFKETPYSGQYVNVAPAGYRKSIRQGPWPPDKEKITVFVFGGSTTFGYGLPDDQTLPSYLQEALSRHTKKNVAVYNFGVAYYYLTQERIRFEKLLLEGHIPDIAIFVDGINEEHRVYDRPWNRTGVGTDSSQSQGAVAAFGSFVGRLPMARGARQLRELLQPAVEPPPPSAEAVQEHLRKFFANQTMIRALGRELGVTPVFVWQPSPFYEYDLKYHLFVRQETVSPVYTAMAEQVRRKPPPDDFLWCADLQQQEHECLYVDSIHYNTKLAQKLADRVCRLCLERRLLAGHGIGVE
jgi:hypothetical protein